MAKDTGVEFPDAGRDVRGRDLKELRKRMGKLTQVQFAEVMALSVAHVIALETERVRVVGTTRVLILWLMSVYGLDGRPPHPSIPVMILPQFSQP